VDRRYLRGLVRSGAVLVNGQEATLQQPLSAMDVVSVRSPEPVENWPRRRGPDTDAVFADLPVLFEDETVLVVHKPAGMPSVPDRAGKDLGVHGRLLELRPGEDLRIVHRLDRDTSGCLALAKGLEAARQLDLAFRSHTVRKHYLLLVAGQVRFQQHSVRASLGPDPRRPGRIRVVPRRSKGARDAHTDLTSLEWFRGYSLLRAAPLTGRSHQIRVHVRHLGHPIVADADYGVSGTLLLSEIKRNYKLRRGVSEKPLLTRMFLHAAELWLPQPGGGTAHAEAPLPVDLNRVLQKLRNFAAETTSRS
jgi:23S rRNA pseudouridine955/2504/2580 synthase/23S rRNA pseudouridine1911/1915/1917 synthase